MRMQYTHFAPSIFYETWSVHSGYKEMSCATISLRAEVFASHILIYILKLDTCSIWRDVGKQYFS